LAFRVRQDRRLVDDALEVYVLCGQRSSITAQRFLNAFAEHRRPVAEDFPFPEFADDPVHTYHDANELVELLETRPNEPYSIYWNVERGSLGEQVMLFFTSDGEMIAGIGGPLKPVEETLAAVASVVDGAFGYVTSGSCPPATTKEFKAICEQSTLPNLFSGKLRSPP